MKKIFTLIALLAATLSMQAAITVYVQAEQAPHLWAWTNAGDIFQSEGWPGHVLTDKKTVQGTEFWYYTFAEDVTSVNINFNNGAGGQTSDINGITTDRYFTYDGATGYEDVTEQYGGVVPDAEVNSLFLVGNHNDWGAGTEFEVVEAGKTFKLTMDMTTTAVADDFWQFKIRPNGEGWVGYWEAITPDTYAWLDHTTDGNFQIDFEQVPAAERIFTILATWGGGKQADKNWTVRISKADETGISAIRTDAVNAQRYDLSGRMVNEGYRGVTIQNGKKFVVK